MLTVIKILNVLPFMKVKIYKNVEITKEGLNLYPVKTTANLYWVVNIYLCDIGCIKIKIKFY